MQIALLWSDKELIGDHLLRSLIDRRMYSFFVELRLFGYLQFISVVQALIDEVDLLELARYVAIELLEFHLKIRLQAELD